MNYLCLWFIEVSLCAHFLCMHVYLHLCNTGSGLLLPAPRSGDNQQIHIYQTKMGLIAWILKCNGTDLP